MKLTVACLLALLPSLASAQPQWWSFESHPYYDPLIAGVREPHVSALIPAFFTRMPMMVSADSPRMGWDIDLGTELPIFGRESAASAGQVGEGEWGWGVWIPIDFHMIEDFRDESAPIVNTDYRFGAMFKFRRGLPNQRWIAARIHVGHESTHLGDEFSINAAPATFERINVSWEYLDVGALYEWQVGQRGWTARGGVTTTLPFGKSYYQTGPGSVTSSSIGPVTESKNWFDPYAGLEFKREGLLFNETFDFYASGELRWRSVYDYHKSDPDQSEERQASVNLIAGIKKTGAGRGIGGRASPFVRLYRGVNPHGQFRNQKDFTEIGIGVRLVR
jgi:Protein of unknown function (DUF1207)